MLTLAERLGFRRDDRVVILNADDVGLCHAQNLGYFEVVESGIITSGSVLVPCSWFPEIATYARRHPEVDLGVHLCLNSECSGYRWRSVADASRVPSLIDRDGYFWASPAETLEKADPRDVETELRAQIDHALESGIDVTHLDAHMGTAMMRRLFSVYVALGREYRLPLFLPRPTKEILLEIGRADAIDTLDEMLDGFDASGVLLVDHAELRSLSFDPDDAEEHYRKVLRELRPGVTHFLIHPAVGGEELRAVTPESWRQREAERRIFSAPDTRRWLEEAGVRSIGYRALRDVIRAS